MNEAAETLMQKKAEFKLTCNACMSKKPEDFCKKCKNRRGDFRAMSVGFSYGGGQTVRVCFYDTALPNTLRL